MGRQLQQIADRENVLFVSISPFVNLERFSIEGQLLIVRGASSQYYNLNQLIRTWVRQGLDENDRRINYFELTFQD